MALKAAIDEAEAIFGLDEDAVVKQKKLKLVLKAYELAPSLFHAVSMEIKSDTDIDAMNGKKTYTHATLEQVMRLEFDNANGPLANEPWTRPGNNMFLTSETNVAVALARARAQVYYQRNVLETMDAYSDARDKCNVQAELTALERAALKEARKAKNAKRIIFFARSPT